MPLGEDRHDDGNDGVNTVDSDDSYFGELEDLTHLPPLDISPLRLTPKIHSLPGSDD